MQLGHPHKLALDQLGHPPSPQTRICLTFITEKKEQRKRKVLSYVMRNLYLVSFISNSQSNTNFCTFLKILKLKKLMIKNKIYFLLCNLVYSLCPKRK